MDSILDCVTSRTRVVFLANPNNPTGSYLSRNEVARLHSKLPKDVLLVIDARILNLLFVMIIQAALSWSISTKM